MSSMSIYITLAWGIFSTHTTRYFMRSKLLTSLMNIRKRNPTPLLSDACWGAQCCPRLPLRAAERTLSSLAVAERTEEWSSITVGSRNGVPVRATLEISILRGCNNRPVRKLMTCRDEIASFHGK